ncbi:MAG: ribosomal protein S18-alanine N-acetyltransferase [Burkholderiales bacterium]|nr:ribosomal protein S18-alanine N-acetyltransferase [Burkholderiales bacterium]
MTRPGVQLRLAQSGDAMEIALMSRDLVEHGLTWSWTRTRVARNMADRDTSTLVAAVGRKIVGFAMMHFGDDHAHLNLFAVKPAYQRGGVGAEMLRWLEQSASAAGLSAIHLEVRLNNVSARRFYRGAGFQDVAVLPRYYGGVESALWMARDIRVRTASQST